MDTPDPAASRPRRRPLRCRASASRSQPAARRQASPSPSPSRSRSSSTFSSVRFGDLGRSSAVVLRQLSQETADGVTGEIEDALKTPYINVLLRTPQQQSDPLNLAAIEPTFEQALATMPFVSRFYVWSDVSTEHQGELLAYDRENEGFHSNLPEAAMVVQRLPRAGAAEARDQRLRGDHRRAAHAISRRSCGSSFPMRDKLTSFVAFRVDAERLRREFFPALVNEKLKSVEGPTGFPPLERDALRRRRAASSFRRDGVDPDGVRRRADVPAGVLRSRAGRRCRRRRGASSNAGASAPATATRPFPRSSTARARPQRALMATAGGGDGPQRLLRRARRGAGSARRRAEIELRVERVARPEDAAGADPAVRRDAGARAG